jgi:hypothetical protein
LFGVTAAAFGYEGRQDPAVKKTATAVTTPAAVPDRYALKPDQIFIDSIPRGLEVYARPADPSEIVQPETASPFIMFSKTHSLIDAKNRIGVTPVVMDGFKPGWYLISVGPVRLFNDKGVKVQIAQDLTLNGLHTPNLESLDRITDKTFLGAAIYQVELTEGAQFLVISAISRFLAFEQWEEFYPAEPSYEFDATTLQAKLESETTFPRDKIARSIDYLKRGGRVLVSAASNIGFVLSARPDRTWEVGYFIQTGK